MASSHSFYSNPANSDPYIQQQAHGGDPPREGNPPEFPPSTVNPELRRRPRNQRKHLPRAHRISARDKYIGVDDVGNRKRFLWRKLLAEFLGTMILVFVGCGSCISWPASEPLKCKAKPAPRSSTWLRPKDELNINLSQPFEPAMIQIALAFGITIATLAQAIGHVSGCNLNPAVSLGLIASGKMSILKAFVYVIAQCAGATCGAGLLKLVTPKEFQGNLGSTTLGPKVEPWAGLVVEILITFVLVLIVSGLLDDDLMKDRFGSGPLAIGFSVSVCHLMAIKYTGSSMNPARSLGPAILSSTWAHHWVYWFGPITGGVLAGSIYRVCFIDRRQRDPL